MEDFCDLTMLEDYFAVNNQVVANLQTGITVLVICICFILAFLVASSLIKGWFFGS